MAEHTNTEAEVCVKTSTDQRIGGLYLSTTGDTKILTTANDDQPQAKLKPESALTFLASTQSNDHYNPITSAPI